MNKLLSAVCSDEGRQFRSIYGNSLSRGSFVLGHFSSSLVVPLYRYLIRRKGGRERNQALLSMRPRETLPHQTKWVRPRRASLGIFNTAGYEVLIALFLTSQIPFSISLSFLSSSPSFSFTLSLFPPSNCLFLCPNFPFSPLSRGTFVLSLPLYFKSVSSCAALLFSLFFSCAFLAACHMRRDTLAGNLFCISSNTS